MIVVTISYRPGGDAKREERLGSVEIANVSKLAPVSDYFVDASDRRGTVIRGIVTHERAKGFWPLVAAAVAEVVRRRTP